MLLGNLSAYELLLLLLVPILAVAGFLMAVRANRSRGEALLAAIAGSLVPSLLVAVYATAAGSLLEFILSIGIPLMIFSAMIGLSVGVIGLVIRALRPWLSKEV